MPSYVAPSQKRSTSEFKKQNFIEEVVYSNLMISWSTP